MSWSRVLPHYYWTLLLLGSAWWPGIFTLPISDWRIVVLCRVDAGLLWILRFQDGGKFDACQSIAGVQVVENALISDSVSTCRNGVIPIYVVCLRPLCFRSVNLSTLFDYGANGSSLGNFLICVGLIVSSSMLVVTLNGRFRNKSSSRAAQFYFPFAFILASGVLLGVVYPAILLDSLYLSPKKRRAG